MATIIDDLDASFGPEIDARYGLIGFGQDNDNGTPQNFQDDEHRFAHTQLLVSAGVKEWTTSHTELVSAILNEMGDIGVMNSEDGWDAIEHAIAEYDFREQAIPVLVLVQGDQGRTDLNDTLTRQGVLSALNSKNAIFNSMISGALLFDGIPPSQTVFEPLHLDVDGNPLNPLPGIDWAPLFPLSPYETTSGDFDDVYILGVEADAADGMRDRQHDFHAFDTVANTVPTSLPATQSDALQISFNGSNTGETGMVQTGEGATLGTSVYFSDVAV